MLRKRIQVLSVLLLLSLIVPACIEGGHVDLLDCSLYVADHKDSRGNPDPCCTDKNSPCPVVVVGMSSGGDGETCEGTCQPLAELPANSDNFMLLWTGLRDQERPPCPQAAPTKALDGFTDLEGNAPAECAPCTCQLPKGWCELSTTMKAYYTHPATCPAPMGTPFQSFDVKAPIPWDGQCNQDNQIAGIPNCAGSMCVQELEVAPPVVHDPPACEPGSSPAPKIDKASFPHHARVCTGEVPGKCPDLAHFCAPDAVRASQESGVVFKECFIPKGSNRLCPQGWNDRHIIYRYDTIKDSRGCTACTCGAPVGSKCSTSVSVYSTASDCTGPHQTVIVDSTQSSWCYNWPSGTAMLSKQAALPAYAPGSCAPSGGESTGAATGDDSLPDSAYTACCREVPQ